MLICDDRAAYRVLFGGRPPAMPINEAIGVTPGMWWRLLRPAHTVVRARATGTPHAINGQHSTPMQDLSDDELDLIRRPDPRVIEVLDARRVLDTAAAIGLDYRGSMMQLEALAAAVVYGGSLWYGRAENLTPPVQHAADSLGIETHLL